MNGADVQVPEPESRANPDGGEPLPPTVRDWKESLLHILDPTRPCAKCHRFSDHIDGHFMRMDYVEHEIPSWVWICLRPLEDVAPSGEAGIEGDDCGFLQDPGATLDFENNEYQVVIRHPPSFFQGEYVSPPAAEDPRWQDRFSVLDWIEGEIKPRLGLSLGLGDKFGRASPELRRDPELVGRLLETCGVVVDWDLGGLKKRLDAVKAVLPGFFGAHPRIAREVGVSFKWQLFNYFGVTGDDSNNPSVHQFAGWNDAIKPILQEVEDLHGHISEEWSGAIEHVQTMLQQAELKEEEEEMMMWQQKLEAAELWSEEISLELAARG